MEYNDELYADERELRERSIAEIRSAVALAKAKMPQGAFKLLERIVDCQMSPTKYGKAYGLSRQAASRQINAILHSIRKSLPAKLLIELRELTK